MGEARRRLRAVRQAMLRRRGGAVGQLRIVDKTLLAGGSGVVSHENVVGQLLGGDDDQHLAVADDAAAVSDRPRPSGSPGLSKIPWPIEPVVPVWIGRCPPPSTAIEEGKW